MAYTDEVNAQVVIQLLKKHGIRRIVASPGATNVSLVGSMQRDSYFEMFSVVDERSAAYIACGMAAESGEPVALSCTGATASRNYMPGMTEAYYRKLPVLAITSSQILPRVGQHIAQVIDRSVIPRDVANLSVSLPVVNNDDDLWDCELKVNRALLELRRRGGGPVHINLPTVYSENFAIKELPNYRFIERLSPQSSLPALPPGRVAIFIGAHAPMSQALTEAIDRFCAAHDAVVFCDHTSGYYGRYRVQYALAAFQQGLDIGQVRPDVLIHLGEVSGDYYSLSIAGKAVWRVSEDGELRDTFRKLRYVFEMPEQTFFDRLNEGKSGHATEYLSQCQAQLSRLRSKLPELPFSNIYTASQLAHRIPKGAVVHFGILNSLRSWNFFEVPEGVKTDCNVGGFGIDGCVSSLIGASWVKPDQLYFAVVGDLAFFYDLNSIGNRHVGRNLRIVLINNGVGVEFKNYNHRAASFDNNSDTYIAAGGHFGNKSKSLVKNFAQDLGFEYLSASNKEELERVTTAFLRPELGERPMLLEVFTDADDESSSLELMSTIEYSPAGRAKLFAKSVLGESGIGALKKLFGR
ncbi:thiamine pyrophosphate-binding protein [Paucibacter sp. PLA-PC-4]|uniref:thiamine pyrophosphate-binding protein n=1 Tax=Paucibacter sp. PLA-PC-4 TaxID=2993655 RepID=UPI00224A9591|nr:thiamine pyrophosphate-binding protein [Paucibacter sp. PLA-PC-4]MCX2865287.1 thiamine pyrophosphate-binding protein [Paucibacter sp. PLA-PC-4]